MFRRMGGGRGWGGGLARSNPFIPFSFNDSVSHLNKLKLEAKMLNVAKIETTDTLKHIAIIFSYSVDNHCNVEKYTNFIAFFFSPIFLFHFLFMFYYY